MKHLIHVFLSILFLTIATNCYSQVLISLLFGEALNSEKIEFGLNGGFNWSNFNDIDEANSLRNFNLGFYFHILMKNNSYLSTGVMVKSSVGASGMSTYPIGDEDFDALFENGSLATKLNAFNVPILYQLRYQNRSYVELGPMLGLRTKAYDIFTTKVIDGDLEYKVDVSDQYKRLDAGFMVGVGYKFRQEIKSIAAGVNYYFGLVNISKLPDQKIRNSSFYVYIKIPIGAGKAVEEDASNNN